MGLLIIIDWLTLLILNISVLLQKPSFKAPWELSASITQITFLVFPIAIVLSLFILLQNAVGFLPIFLHFTPTAKEMQEAPGITIICI